MRRSLRPGERERAGPAERGVRRVPLVPRDGARVVRGRGDGGVHERALREHQGRPRGAAGRRRGLHAGDGRAHRAGRLADDLRARPRGQPVLRRHLLPRPAAARAAELPPAAGGDRRRLDQPLRRGGRGLDAASARPWPGPWSSPAGRPSTARRSTTRSARSDATSTQSSVGSAARRSSRRRWCWSSCSGCRRARPAAGAPRRRTWPGRTLASMAAGGIHDQLAGGFARYGVDRAWVVPHFEKMLYDNGQLLSVYARWAALNDDEDAARVARGDRRLHARRAGHRRGCVRLRAGCGLRGRGGHLLRLDARPSWSRCSVPTTAPGPPSC